MPRPHSTERSQPAGSASRPLARSLAGWANTIPADKRLMTIGCFFTLFGIMAGHTLLETARDALFLASLPASHLAWVYLGIAGLAVAVAQAQHRLLDRWGGPYLLSALLVAASAITLAFWWLTGWRNPWVFYALYIWGSLLATTVTIHFWLVLGGAYTLGEAKRAFAVIGAGSVLGAIAGAGTARWVTHVTDARHLLVASAACLAVTAAGPILSLRGRRRGGEQPTRRRHYSLLENVPLLRDQPYLRRVATLVLASTVTFTLVDYLFKSEVKQHIAPERLGSFFATLSLALNATSLVVQLVGVPVLIARLGVTRAVLILPVLLFGGGVAIALSSGLLAVLLMKGVDGGLRYSLHRTTTELLYVPVSDSLRARVKGLMDGAGQRGGQALGSLVILGAVGLGHDREALAAVAAIVAAVWLAMSLGLRRDYLDLFRTTLAGGAGRGRLDLPALDMRSLETFIAALNSEDDAEVLAALDLLADQGRARLIPALIVHHPSRDVVLRALEIFAQQGHDGSAPVRRLLKHPDPEIRAAAVRASSAVQLSEPLLRACLDDPSPIVSTTALVLQTSLRTMPEEESRRALLAIADDGTDEARTALVRAIVRRTGSAGATADRSADHVFEEILLRLVARDGLKAIPELPQAMGEIRSEAFVPTLVEMLASRELVPSARAALVAIGAPALAYLDRTMTDPEAPPQVLRHVPRTISRFDAEAAIPILMKHLPTAPDGMVRYKILRGLGRLRTEAPHVPLDPIVLDAVTDQTAREALLALDWRLRLDAGARAHPGRASSTLELLIVLLRDKETMALERLFRLLDLRHPGEDLERVYRALRGADEKARASARELLENLIEEPLRTAVLALGADAPDEQRLEQAARYYQPEEFDYETLLGKMIASRSESLRCLAAYHVGEVGLVALRDRLEAAVPRAASPLRSVMERALAMLDASATATGVARAG